jgi:hypothetical protein
MCEHPINIEYGDMQNWPTYDLIRIMNNAKDILKKRKGKK